MIDASPLLCIMIEIHCQKIWRAIGKYILPSYKLLAWFVDKSSLIQSDWNQINASDTYENVAIVLASREN